MSSHPPASERDEGQELEFPTRRPEQSATDIGAHSFALSPLSYADLDVDGDRVSLLPGQGSAGRDRPESSPGFLTSKTFNACPPSSEALSGFSPPGTLAASWTPFTGIPRLDRSGRRQDTSAAPKNGLSLSRNFVPPHWPDVLLLSIVVALSWNIGQFITPAIATGYTLNTTRLLVAVSGVVIGLLCGYALILRIGKRLYSAVVFGTLTQMEMALHEIDRCAEVGPLSALYLLKFRLAHRQNLVNSRVKRPWTFCLAYFLLLFSLSQSASFVFGRVVSIETYVQPQFKRYHPLPVLGELTDADLAYASTLQPFFEDFLTTWTLSSFASINVPSSTELPFDSYKVTFTQASSSLFSDTAVGPAAATWNDYLDQSKALGSNDVAVDDATAKTIAQESNNKVPVAVLYPTWGARVSCKTASDGGLSLFMNPNSTVYMTTSVQILEGLLSEVGGDVALASTAPVQGDGRTIATGLMYNNGVATSFFSNTLDMGRGGAGYVGYDFVLVRLNTSAAPGGEFLATMPGESGSLIGVDAAICATRISPYVVRARDDSGIVTLNKVITSGNDVGQAKLPKASALEPLFEAPVQQLVSLNKSVAYINAFSNSRNQLLKDNGRDFYYVANPTAILLSNISTAVNATPQAYGVLDSVAVERVMSSITSRFLLPYLIGRGRVEGRAYVYETRAKSTVNPAWLAALMCSILAVGLIGAFCIPRFPDDLPLRDMTPSSWIKTYDANLNNMPAPSPRQPGEWKSSRLRYMSFDRSA